MSISTYILIGLIFAGYSTPKDVKDIKKRRPDLFEKNESEVLLLAILISLITATLLWPAAITAAVLRKVRRKK